MALYPSSVPPMMPRQPRLPAGLNQAGASTPGSWIAHKDIHGQTFWQNNVTGAWTYNIFDNNGCYFQPPPPPSLTAPPLPMVYGAPAAHVPFQPMACAPTVPHHASGRGKYGKKKQTLLWAKWQDHRDFNGDRCWRHALTGRIVYKDPYY